MQPKHPRRLQFIFNAEPHCKCNLHSRHRPHPLPAASLLYTVGIPGAASAQAAAQPRQGHGVPCPKSEKWLSCWFALISSGHGTPCPYFDSTSLKRCPCNDNLRETITAIIISTERSLQWYFRNYIIIQQRAQPACFGDSVFSDSPVEQRGFGYAGDFC